MGLVCGRSSTQRDPEATHEPIPAEASSKDAHFSAKCPVDPSLALALSHAADLLQDSPIATTPPGGSLQPCPSQQSTGGLPDPEGSTAHEVESSASAGGSESKLLVGGGGEEGVVERTNGSDVGAVVGVAKAEGHEMRPQTARPEGKKNETAAKKAIGWSGAVPGRGLSGQRRSFYGHSQRTGALPRGGAAPGGASVVHKDRAMNETEKEAPGRNAGKRDPLAQQSGSENRRKECAGVAARGASTKGPSPAKSGSLDKGGLHDKQGARVSKLLERPVSQPLPGAKRTAPVVGGRKRCVGPKPRGALIGDAFGDASIGNASVKDASIRDASIGEASNGEQRKASCGEKEGTPGRVAVSRGEMNQSGGETAAAGGGEGNREQKPSGRVGSGGMSGVAENRKVLAERARPKSEVNQVVGRTLTGVSSERAGVGFGRGMASLAGRSSSRLLTTSGDKVTSVDKVSDKAPVKTASPRKELESRTKALGDGQKRTGTAGSLSASMGSGRRALTPPEGKQRALGGPKSAGVKNEGGLPKGQLRKSPSAPSIIGTSEKAARASGVRKAGEVTPARRERAGNGLLRSSHVARSYSPVLEPEIITAPVSRVLRSLVRSLSERASEAGATFVYPDEWEVDTWPARDVGACGACRLSLLERSPYCRGKSHGDSDMAPDEVSMHSVLVCGHFYHSECLERSVFGHETTDGTCPRCLLPGL